MFFWNYVLYLYLYIYICIYIYIYLYFFNMLFKCLCYLYFLLSIRPFAFLAGKTNVYTFLKRRHKLWIENVSPKFLHLHYTFQNIYKLRIISLTHMIISSATGQCRIVWRANASALFKCRYLPPKSSSHPGPGQRDWLSKLRREIRALN